MFARINREKRRVTSAPDDRQNCRDDGPAAARRLEVAGLFERHNDILVRVLATKLGSVQEARDVAQEAYVRVLGLDDDTVVSHLRAYLFRTANNIAIDRLRERVRRRESAQVDPEEAGLKSNESSAEELVDVDQRLALIRQFVTELPPKCRLAFLLFKFECRSYREIADRLDIGESMVRKYVLRGVRHCHRRLRESTGHGSN